MFIQPVVVTVKKDGSFKIALDARALNESIAKNKYQMPNLENLMDMIAEKIEGQEGEVLYSSVDLKHAYGQVPLHENTARHRNFQIIGGKSTGTYRFITAIWANDYAHGISESDGSDPCNYRLYIFIKY